MYFISVYTCVCIYIVVYIHVHFLICICLYNGLIHYDKIVLGLETV